MLQYPSKAPISYFYVFKLSSFHRHHYYQNPESADYHQDYPFMATDRLPESPQRFFD